MDRGNSLSALDFNPIPVFAIYHCSYIHCLASGLEMLSNKNPDVKNDDPRSFKYAFYCDS